MPEPVLPGEPDTPKERRHLAGVRGYVTRWNKKHPTATKAVQIVGGTAVAVAAATAIYSNPTVPCAGGIQVGCSTPVFSSNSDITPPVATLTAPAAQAVLSGTVAITATATDNVAVAGVKFYVDGIQQGSEDTTNPYSINYDSTALSNGAHTISAIARDTSNNLSTPTLINVTHIVANTSVSVDTANMWVAPSAGASPQRNDTAFAFDSTKAYASFGAAYAASQPGDVIGVACVASGTGVGTGIVSYPSQTLAYNATIDAGQQLVTIAPLDGCTPTVGVWTTLTNDYAPTTDTTVTVGSTTGFSTSKPIYVDGNVFHGVTCTGTTSTTFTGCGTQVRNITLRGGFAVPVSQDGTLSFADSTYIHVQGINVATYVSLTSTVAHTGNFQEFTDAAVATKLDVFGGTNALVKNVVIGPYPDSVNQTQTLIAPFSSGATDKDPTSVTFDNVFWNAGNANACLDPTNGFCHSEQIFLRYANGLTIQNSKFSRYEQYAIFASSFATSSGTSRQNTHEAENVLIQNNYFGPASCKTSDGVNPDNAGTVIVYPCHGIAADYAIELNANAGKDYSTCPQTACWTIRFNTFGEGNKAVAGIVNTSPSKMIYSSNYGRANWSCDPGLTYDHNVVTSAACTGTGNLGGQTFDIVDENSVDFHLSSSGASAIAKGTTTAGAFPTTDKDGTLRGSSPDAGADQFAAGNAGSGGHGMALGLSTKNTVTVNSTTRYYKTYHPSNLQDQSNLSGVPLVVVLNDAAASSCTGAYATFTDCDLGTSVSGSGEIANFPWHGEADAKGFVVLYIEGYDNCASSCTQASQRFGVDAPALIDAAVAEVESSATKGANIDTSHIYLTGYFNGGNHVFQAFCGENGGVNTNSNDWTTLTTTFAGYGIMAGIQYGTAKVEAVDHACSYPTGVPVINITSKGDVSFPNDDARVSGTGGSPVFSFVCALRTTGQSCSPRAGTYTAAQYGSHYSCAVGPTTNVVATAKYTSYTSKDYTSCTPSAAKYRWISIGTTVNGTNCSTGTGSPSHAAANYNCVGPVMADLIWTWWTT